MRESNARAEAQKEKEKEESKSSSGSSSSPFESSLAADFPDRPIIPPRGRGVRCGKILDYDGVQWYICFEDDTPGEVALEHDLDWRALLRENENLEGLRKNSKLHRRTPLRLPGRGKSPFVEWNEARKILMKRYGIDINTEAEREKKEKKEREEEEEERRKKVEEERRRKAELEATHLQLLRNEAEKREAQRKADQLRWRRKEERLLQASGRSASTFEVTVTRTSESVGVNIGSVRTTEGGQTWGAKVIRFTPLSKTMRRGELEESGCVKPGDVLFEVNEMAADSPARARALIADVPEGAALRFKFWRVQNDSRGMDKGKGKVAVDKISNSDMDEDNDSFDGDSSTVGGGLGAGNTGGRRVEAIKPNQIPRPIIF